jgi:hypothetical protein
MAEADKPTKKTKAKKAQAKTAKATAKPAAKKTATKKAVAKKTAVKKAEAKVAAPKKAAPKKAAAKKTVARKKAPAKTAATTPKRIISAEERYRMVEEAAYYKAEARHFAPGDTGADWLAAEAEVDARLADEGVIVSG